MGAQVDLQRGRGRPRDADADRRILRAAAQHLRALGYEQMSMEQVAADAGVGKATLYRRYRDKADLATAAVAALTARRYAAPLPDDTREALVEHLRRFERVVGEAGFGVLSSLLGARTDRALLELHRERVIARGKASGLAILRRAQERGEVREDADTETALEMLVGSYFARRLTGRACGDWPEAAVDTLLRGLTRR